MGFVTRRSAIRRGSRGTRGDKPSRGAALRKSSTGYQAPESNIFRAVKEKAPYSNRGVNLSSYAVSRLPDVLQNVGMSLKDIELSAKHSTDFAERLERILESETEILAAHGALVRAKKFQEGGLNIANEQINRGYRSPVAPKNMEPSKFRLAYEALKQRLEGSNNA